MALDEISIADLKQLNEANGGCWFSPDSMRFFNCSLPHSAKLYDNKAYFASGEKYNTEPRMYTIRAVNMANGEVDTVGEFQEYYTLDTAKAAIREIVKA